MASITTASAREKLKPRHAPYFTEVVRGELSLGYRKNLAGGNWVAKRTLEKRQRIGDSDQWTTGRYATKNIGPVDDRLKDTTDFDRAEAKAKVWLRQEVASNGAKPITVKEAVEAYIVKRETQERARKGGAGGQGQGGLLGLKRDAKHRLTRHVLCDTRLAALPLEQLAKKDLEAWRTALASTLAIGRKSALAPSTIRRTVSDLKAALNAAHEQHETLPAELALVIKKGLKADKAKAAVARPAQVLPDADVRRILAAAAEIDAGGNWGDDLSRMVLVLAATGTRFSQAIRLIVADVQAEQSRIMVPVSHKGKGEKAATHVAVPVGEDVIKALRPILAGRTGSEILLLRPRWEQVAPVEWKLVDRAPWKSASELVRPWAKIIAKTGLKADLVPYCLRHSSIVRGLKAGLPITLVADLHDTSAAMIEAHYAAFIVGALHELAARAVVPMVTPAPTPMSRAASVQN
jgi:integrase